MPISITRRAGLAGGLALLLAGAVPAGAETFPTKSIRFVVPFSAGSATDTLARVVGQSVSQQLGQPVVVENVPGANGQIAASQVARAAPDGYTVLITSNSTHASNQALVKKLSYDHVKDFEPITTLGTITLALVVNPAVPVATTQELIAYAKANPGKLSFGAGSTSSRLAVEMLKSQAGVDILYVPYKSNPQAVSDLLGGQISLMFADISTTLPAARAGKLKALGVSSAERSALAPNLPTMREAGIAGYELTAWFAAFAPAKTPADVVATLNKALVTAMGDKTVAAALVSAGIEPSSSTPAQLAAFVQSETKKWAEITKAAGIEPE
ncbi:Bug family tripartite tricarboxylate transporter substrate binding protein [Aquabacter spiritensis]|uniref:Tripartite-type tricarboxylate transporter receptor subunit TctC n=1 Tax=Aquabacter spiritensis TaxID=933073 RepID=A0A4R3LY93_9HYPH|nr:tripartite tricarboxylate transporter substrate binding protein [Aquabacter spiritensis]TCT05622.1 tripartite-type tricarboxylate transporter receptor subunit TctC [Aquabacter spiritensis]